MRKVADWDPLAPETLEDPLGTHAQLRRRLQAMEPKIRSVAVELLRPLLASGGGLTMNDGGGVIRLRAGYTTTVDGAGIPPFNSRPCSSFWLWQLCPP